MAGQSTLDGIGPDRPGPDGARAGRSAFDGAAPGMSAADGSPGEQMAFDGAAPELDGDDGKPPATRAQRALRAMVEWLLVAGCALVLALLLQAYLVQAFSIPSRSMEPTLMVGDRVVVYKLGYRLHDINRGDVVVFHKPDETSHTDDLIKRVVAVGGETFELRGGRVYIDGELLDEPYLEVADSTFPKGPIPGCATDAAPDRCEVPEGMILVLGDNRQSSRDGRYFGPIDADTVVGRAFMKYWPPNDLGGL